MMNTVRTTTRPGRSMPGRAVLLALAGAHAAGCGHRVVEPDPPVTEGEAILAALEYVAEGKWGRSSFHSSRLGGPRAELGGEGVLVTRGTDGLAVQSVMVWIT